MTDIVAVNFNWSIESCDKAPRDLNYERNTEKYGHAMKLTIMYPKSMKKKKEICFKLSFLQPLEAVHMCVIVMKRRNH